MGHSGPLSLGSILFEGRDYGRAVCDRSGAVGGQPLSHVDRRVRARAVRRPLRSSVGYWPSSAPVGACRYGAFGMRRSGAGLLPERPGYGARCRPVPRSWPGAYRMPRLPITPGSRTLVSDTPIRRVLPRTRALRLQPASEQGGRVVAPTDATEPSAPWPPGADPGVARRQRPLLGVDMPGKRCRLRARCCVTGGGNRALT